MRTQILCEHLGGGLWPHMFPKKSIVCRLHHLCGHCHDASPDMGCPHHTTPHHPPFFRKPGSSELPHRCVIYFIYPSRPQKKGDNTGVVGLCPRQLTKKRGKKWRQALRDYTSAASTLKVRAGCEYIYLRNFFLSFLFQ